MDARQLEYFLAVVDQGGFTKAAAALHVTQPALSQAVRALERDLGAQLFQRAGRGVVLSAAGEALVGPAREVMGGLLQARSAVEQVVGLVAGRLDLVVQPAAVDVAAELAALFRSHHPQVTVRLVEPRRPPYLARDLREGDAHLGISYLPLWEGEGLEVERLREVEMVAVLPPGAEAGPDPLPVHRLAGVPLVAGRPGSAWRELVDRTLADAAVKAEIAVETDFRDAIAPVVLNGGAAAVLPRTHAAELARLGAVLRRLEPAVSRGVGLVHRRGPLPPAAAAFRAVAREWAES